MPLGMVVGAIFYKQIVSLDTLANHMLTPVLIFAMLFLTYCRVDVTKMRLSRMHYILLAFQLFGSIAVYLSLFQFSETVAQGTMICVLAPIAMAAVVIGGMLGASIETMATYSLFCNLATAVFAPFIIRLTGNEGCTLIGIISKVAPLLLLPFITGQIVRYSSRRVVEWVGKNSKISFYLWLISLTIIIGKTTNFILEYGFEDLTSEIWMVILSFIICIIQFSVGRYIGRQYGDVVAGGQSLGQKNTILAVWMAQSFLHPLASVAPTAYIVWQNFVNSYQIWKKKEV